jgi:probable rRNA maturation factor
MNDAPPRRAETPSVDIQIQSPLWHGEKATEQTVRDAIAAAAAALSTADGEVAILLTDDETIRALNRQWRGIDKPTNVLSFPAANPDIARFLGDIAIAYETLKRECGEESREFHHHLAHLTVHGFLHLVGYDHETNADAAAMEGLESRIMARLNMPDPYRGRDIEPGEA